VIGPNGSGKSNLAEAIRWVLGEQSLKRLRGQKSEDVIFAGGTGRTRSGSARVSLTFDNESGRLPVEAPEVTITRMINRSGEGEYFVNGDVVRLSDIHQMLAEAGLGTKSYTVISQGMVDQYLAATPAGRRELFDEACGIKALQLKLARAERTLRQAEQREQELAAVLAELKPRLTILKRQAGRMQQRDELEEAHRTAQAQWYRVSWHDLSREVHQAQAAVETVTQQRAAARQQREVIEGEVLAAMETGSDRQKETAVQRERELLAAQHEYERAVAEFERQQKEREELKQSLAAIQRSRQEAEQQLAAARTLTESHNLFVSLRKLLTQVRDRLQAWRGGQQPAADELATLEDAIAQTLVQLEEEDTTVAAAQSLVSKLEGPLQAVARLQAIEQERLSRLEQLPKLKKPSAQRVEELEAAWQQVAQPSGQRQQLEERLAAARQEELAAEREGSAAQAALEQAQQDLAELEDEIKRERGTAFTQEIQQTPPGADDQAVTAEDVQQLAMRLAAIGDVDPLIIKEYEEVAARYEHLAAQLSDAQSTRENTMSLIRSLRAETETRFRTQFTAIGQGFQQYFQLLFGGGAARLELVEVADDDEAMAADDSSVKKTIQGIEIAARPPGKKLAGVQVLSGGERALTSLALLLAIVQVQQPPFVVLDEVDAALDEANSYRFAEMLTTMSTTTQCVVVTHNRQTMGSAHVLYGITMGSDGASQVYSVKLSELAETEPAEEMTV